MLNKNVPILWLMVLLPFLLSNCKKNKDDTPSGYKPCDGHTTLTDIDGNTYTTVEIGKQCWMAENLKTSKFRDGSAIPTDLDNTAWSSTTLPAYCVYDDLDSLGAIYGKLYNWYAVSSSKKLAPSGWHIPSEAEWTTLQTYLGGGPFAGGKMKSTNSDYWQLPNVGATNSSRFNARGSGYRTNDASNYMDLTYVGIWWTASNQDFTHSYYYGLYHNVEEFYYDGQSKQYGYAVRCIKD